MLWIILPVWVLGVGSLMCFGLFLWTGSFGILDLRLEHRSLLVFDTGLCFLFFFQHSILIRRSVRNSLRRFLPEYCHGVAYTISSSLALLLLVALWQSSPVYIYQLHGPVRWILRAALLLAFVGIVWGIGALERFDAFGTEEFLAHTRRKESTAPRLTVKGPYRLVRHPFYAFAIVAVWATPALPLDRLLFNLLFTVWILVGAALEERDLVSRFGEEYARYRRAVPMFVPRLGKLPTDQAEVAVKSAGHSSETR